jgi:hypothetical protein
MAKGGSGNARRSAGGLDAHRVATSVMSEPILPLPHDYNAERALLASIILSNENLHEALRHGLEPTDFHSLLHRKIYTGVIHVSASEKPIDLVMLHGYLQEAHLLTSEADRVAFFKITDGQHKGANAASYAQRVAECSRRRRIMQHAEAVIQASSAGTSVEDLDERLEAFAKAAQTTSAKKLELAAPMDLANAVTAPAESVDWIIKPWMAKGDLVIAASEPGVGKSWLALDLGVTLARGGSFLGRLDVKTKLRVLYVDLENGPRLARWRFQRIAHALGLTAKEAAAMSFHYIVQDSLNLGDAANRQMLIRRIESFRPDIVIFDTLKRMHRCNENDNSEMSSFFADAVRPLLMTHGCSVIILHHLAKPGPDRSRDDILNRLRGAGDIAGVADQVWGLQATGESSFSLSHIKHRWGKPGANLSVEIEDTEDHRGVRLSGTESLGRTAGIVDRMLEAGGLTGALRSDLVKEVGKTVGAKGAGKFVSRELGRLRQRGKVKKKGNKAGMRYWTTSHAPEDAE